MNETVLSALIGACGAVIVCLIIQSFVSKEGEKALQTIEFTAIQRICKAFDENAGNRT